jgi:tellurite methyltransferase
MKETLKQQFGNIDIYLFDQLLKGRFDTYKTILDAGCGKGRNLDYFLQNRFDVYAFDRDPEAIDKVKKKSLELAPHIPAYHFQVSGGSEIPFEDQRFNAVISNAVLHFANDEDHFQLMIDELWRVLKSQGLLFVRLASSIGIEDKIKPIKGRRYLLPNNTERFLVNEEMLLEITKRLDATLLDPIKTTNVQNLRCMTTWCLQKK